MNEVLLANLFFIITGSAVLVLTTFLCVLCYYGIKIVRQARNVLTQVEAGTEQLVRDVETVRERLMDGTIFGRVFSAVMSAMTTVKAKRTSSHKKTVIVSEE